MKLLALFLATGCERSQDAGFDLPSMLAGAALVAVIFALAFAVDSSRRAQVEKRRELPDNVVDLAARKGAAAIRRRGEARRDSSPPYGRAG